ncbi:MAG: hypothetical protein IT379_13760 [Deltaproteobacteria bacterium]|nr:hypothetical protein [Deltaproteobacteria bacterium]
MALTVAIAAAAGCGLEVNPPEGVFACSEDRECPSGWHCRADLRCWASPASGTAPDAGPEGDRDATPDAEVESDSGAPSDSGRAPDTGTERDSSTPFDSGAPSDAGSDPDAGTRSDTGAPQDSGVRDSGPRPDAGCAETSCTTLIVGVSFGPDSLGCSLAGVASISWQLLDEVGDPISGYDDPMAPCADVRVGPVPGAWYGLHVSATGSTGRYEGTCTRLLVGGSGGGSIRYPCTVPAAP